MCAFEVRSFTKCNACTPLLVSHPVPLVAFLVVEPPFPRFRSFQKYHRHPLPSQARSFSTRQFCRFVIYAFGFDLQLCSCSTSAWKGRRRKKFDFSSNLLVDYSAVSKHRFRTVYWTESKVFFETRERHSLAAAALINDFYTWCFFFLLPPPPPLFPFSPSASFRLPSRGFFHATPFFYFLLTFGSRGAALPSFFIVPRIKFRCDFKPYELNVFIYIPK